MPIAKAIAAPDNPFGFASPDAYHRVVKVETNMLDLTALVTVHSYQSHAVSSTQLSPIFSRVFLMDTGNFLNIWAIGSFAVQKDPWALTDAWLLTQPAFSGGSIVT